MGGGHLQLVLEAAYDLLLARHHGVEADLGHLGGVILLLLPTLVSSMSARSKKRVSSGPA
jgi:hypothetical protein